MTDRAQHRLKKNNPEALPQERIFLKMDIDGNEWRVLA
jgi:hypothetical protein